MYKIDLSWMQPQNITPDPAMSRSMWHIVWDASSSEFFLNRVCEQVKKHGRLFLRLQRTPPIEGCNDVLNFTRLSVTPIQVYNHLRTWRHRWALVCKVRNVEGVTLICKESTSLLMDEDKLRAHHMVSLQITSIYFYLFIPSYLAVLTHPLLNLRFPQNNDLLNKPIVKYKLIKTIFEPTYVCIFDLFTPSKLVA
jgi:hypothetical protein